MGCYISSGSFFPSSSFVLCLVSRPRNPVSRGLDRPCSRLHPGNSRSNRRTNLGNYDSSPGLRLAKWCPPLGTLSSGSYTSHPYLLTTTTRISTKQIHFWTVLFVPPQPWFVSLWGTSFGSGFRKEIRRFYFTRHFKIFKLVGEKFWFSCQTLLNLTISKSF